MFVFADSTLVQWDVELNIRKTRHQGCKSDRGGKEGYFLVIIYLNAFPSVWFSS